jgi:hypothetical protein
MHHSEILLKEAVGAQGRAGKEVVGIGLDDTTHGVPQALHRFYYHRQGRCVPLALGSSHRGVQLVPAWHEATRLDPPGDGIRRLVEMRCRPGEWPLLFSAHADQDQGARYNPHPRVEGHGALHKNLDFSTIFCAARHSAQKVKILRTPVCKPPVMRMVAPKCS